MRRAGDEASSSTFGILGAMALFAAGLSTPLLLAQDAHTGDLEHQVLQTEARDIVSRLTRAADGNWSSDPANATGYGLLSPDGRSRLLDEAKVAALARTRDAGAYERLRERTGADRDLHLSIRPLLPALADPAWQPLELESVAYLANEKATSVPVRLATSVSVDKQNVNASAVVTNLGDEPAIYTVEFGLGNAVQNTLLLQQGRNTRLLAPGESQTVWARFDALAAWDPATNGARIRVLDPFGEPGVDASGAPVPVVWRTVQSLPTLARSSYTLLLDATDAYADAGSPIAFDLDHYGAGGTRVVDAIGRFTLRGPDGREWVNQTVSLPAVPGAVHHWECANCTLDGAYTAVLYDSTLRRAQQDIVVYSSLRLFDRALQHTEAARNEIAALDALVAGFDASRYDAATAPGGDVFSDRAKGGHVANHLDRYRTLVIGTDVQQSALTPNATKNAIRDWVEHGGSLLVLGSPKGPQEWMNPLWKISLARETRAPAAADASAPALTLPDALAWPSYTGGKGWTLGDPSKFDIVLAPGGDTTRAMLAYSQPGAFGNGTLALTSFAPGALAAPYDPLEGRRFLHDLLVHAHTRLYLELGPPVGEGTIVAADERLVAARSALFPAGGAVLVRVHVNG